MKTETSIRAGYLSLNHNETLVKEGPKGLRVKTHIRAGLSSVNHNETLVANCWPHVGPKLAKLP